MHKPFSYTLLASSLLFSLNALAQPAGDLPLMPWPKQVELAQPQGKLVLDYRLSFNVQGDDLSEAQARWRDRLETPNRLDAGPTGREKPGGNDQHHDQTPGCSPAAAGQR
ncbi:Uncharacterised protein [Serratia fonticola]|uniref:Uncharacterized protein n=1 Tax=Serratia fonticola TaxID=47917 RepID=A0A4U9TXJ7_SERFO|nr:Uncharacterised protein [Serratia fonticola]